MDLRGSLDLLRRGSVDLLRRSLDGRGSFDMADFRRISSIGNLVLGTRTSEDGGADIVEWLLVDDDAMVPIPEAEPQAAA